MKKDNLDEILNSNTEEEHGEGCIYLQDHINDYLNSKCDKNFNTLESCDDETSCPCSTASGSDKGKVDLVILVDSSTSMKPTWQAISDASGELENAVKDKCGAKIRVTKLFLDTKGDGSKDDGFTSSGLDPSYNVATYGFTSHEKYILNNTSYTGPFETNDIPALSGQNPEGEQGARGIADVSRHFPWQEGACRTILYVSDEWLDSGVRGENNSFDAIPIATNAANSNTVSVFAHLVETSRSLSLLSSSPSIADHYKLISESTTGGAAYIGEKPTAELYIDLVADAACNCGGGCIEVENPEIKPCISISWGDSDCDNLETEDFEKLCISVCNCYSNVTFSNLTIAYVYISNADGSPVSNLPNGTPSIEAIPLGPICFGDIKPCVDGKETCVSREFVIKSCGAKAGEYKIELGSICYEVTLYYREKACFNFELCDS